MIDIACDPRHFVNQRDSRRNHVGAEVANPLNYPMNTANYPLNPYLVHDDVHHARNSSQSSTFSPDVKYQGFSTSQSSNYNQSNLRYATHPPQNQPNSGSRYFNSRNSQNSQSATPSSSCFTTSYSSSSSFSSS